MDTVELDHKYIWQTYRRHKLSLKKAKLQYVWDESGKRYLDFFAGISVTNFGHCNPVIVKAVTDQIKTLGHTSNWYYTRQNVELAKMLIDRTIPGKVFFSNSGAEANECAIKLARRYGNIGKTKRYEVITFLNSFHGRTFATMSATGQEKVRKNYGSLLSGFKYAKFNDIDSVKKLITKKTVAIMLEVIQGEGGIYIATKEFLYGIQRLCKTHKLLLILDEVQCGLGRAGKFCAYQYYGIKPHIITFAKSLANGLPIGATIAANSIAKHLTYGDHGSTFGANPVTCAAAIAVVKQLTPSLLNHINNLGYYFYKPDFNFFYIFSREVI